VKHLLEHRLGVVGAQRIGIRDRLEDAVRPDEGTGTVAVVSDGPPVLLETGGAPTFCDPQAAIVWSQGVKTSIKTEASLNRFEGMGSGESVQVAFSGEGWVLVQPSEGRVAERVSGTGQGGGGIGGLLGNLTQ
jgi:hypothetical protein